MTSCCSIAKTNLYSHLFVHMSTSKRKQAKPSMIMSSTSLISSLILTNSKHVSQKTNMTEHSKLSLMLSRQASLFTKFSKVFLNISLSVHASFHLDDLFCVIYSIFCRHYQRSQVLIRCIFTQSSQLQIYADD